MSGQSGAVRSEEVKVRNVKAKPDPLAGCDVKHVAGHPYGDGAKRPQGHIGEGVRTQTFDHFDRALKLALPLVQKLNLFGAKAYVRQVLGDLRTKIGAGSVVLKDVAPHTSVAGVPAVMIGQTTVDAPALDMDHSL